MIDYKNDSFYKKKEDEGFKIVKYFKAIMVISFLLIFIFFVFYSPYQQKKKTFENAFQGEVRSFVIKEKGSNWMYVDGGAYT